MEKSREYSDDIQYQLAYRQGAEEAMEWIDGRMEDLARERKQEASRW